MVTDMRDAIFNEIYNVVDSDEDVVVLVADIDSFGLKRIKKDFPDRFYNVGVAEQNMINLAAGLALSGKSVFVCAIAPFTTFRCFEQIKANVCSMNLPVFIIGMGIGLSFGFDGPTHHSVCDIGVMSNLPELSIYNPSDEFSAVYSVLASYNEGRPSYIRVDKGEYKPLYACDSGVEWYWYKSGFKVIKKGDKIGVIGTGITSHISYEAIKHIKENSNFDIKLMDVYRIKPLWEGGIVDEIKDLEYVIVIEEHVNTGGLGDAIGRIILKNKLNVKLHKISLPDEQNFEYGDRKWLHRKYGINRETAINFIVNRCFLGKIYD